MQPKAIFAAVLAWLTILAGLYFGASIRLPGWGAVALYLAIYLSMRYGIRQFAGEAEASAIWKDWPTSGPIGAFGQPGLKAGMAISGLMCFFNPAQCRQLLAQAAGNRRAAGRAAHIVASSRCTEILYSPPFDGEWLVYHGGCRQQTSHSWQVVAQRYAHDFVIANARVERHRGRGTRVEDYFCHAVPILAAADGEVVSTRSDCATSRFLGFGLIDFLAADFIGNHVLIRHAPEEYALYAHLAPESVAVRPGDIVVRGQAIGACGHTGHSAEPHLHFHVQDSADMHGGAGLPIRFTGLKVNGESRTATLLDVGDRIQCGSRSG